MRITLPLSLVLAATLLGACKRTPPAPLPSCRDDLARPDVMRLQQRAREGADPCPELAAPKIEVDAQGVSLDGVVVVAPSELPSRRAENIAPLFQKLEGRRHLWKQIHPGETFAPKVDLVVAPEIGGNEGASVVRSAAWAGFDAIHVKSGDVTVDFAYATPRPPGAPPEEGLVHVHPSGTFHDTAKAIQDELAKAGAGKHRVAFERGT